MRTEGEIKVRENYEYGGLVDEKGFEIIEITNMAINVNVPDNKHWGSYPNGHREISLEEAEANAEHIRDTWNASTGMTTEQAVAYLKHGAEILEFVRSTSYSFDLSLRQRGKKLLTKLEVNDER